MAGTTAQHGENLYTRLLWRTMDFLNVTDTITRKMMAAVTLQFISTIGLFLLPLGFFRAAVFGIFPPSLMAMTAVVVALALVAFFNTLLIVRKSLSNPLSELQETAIQLGNGNTDVSVPEVDQHDELGDLATADTVADGRFVFQSME